MRPVEESAKRFQLLADPIRLRILLRLEEQEQCVGDLTEALGISQPQVSYHLRLMLAQGIIQRRSEGPWCYYSLAIDIRQWVEEQCKLLLNFSARAG